MIFLVLYITVEEGEVPVPMILKKPLVPGLPPPTA